MSLNRQVIIQTRKTLRHPHLNQIAYTQANAKNNYATFKKLAELKQWRFKRQLAIQTRATARVIPFFKALHSGRMMNIHVLDYT